MRCAATPWIARLSLLLLLSGCGMDEPERETVIPSCIDQYDGQICTDPGARCETEGWCCRCGCEGQRSCRCDEETGRWQCAPEDADVCFYCDYNVDTSEPPSAGDTMAGDDVTGP